MKKIFALAGRNMLEILRDPLTTVFGIALPVLLLAILSMINKSTGEVVAQFAPECLVPAVCVFSLSFLTLFSGMILAKDRTTSFLSRLFAAPVSAAQFILGYTLPFLPVAGVQLLLCIAAGLCLGLPLNGEPALLLLSLIPSALLYLGIGMLCGVLFTDRQVGGICGGALVNFSALFSGMWFDLSLTGRAMETIAHIFPFAHAVDLARAVYSGADAALNVAVVLGYAVLCFAAAIPLFCRKMKNGKN